MVAVPGAVICFARDAICDWLRWRRERSSRVAELEQDAASIGGHRHASQSHEAGTSQALDGEVIELGPMASKSNNEAPDTAKDEDKQSPASPPSPGDKASTNSAPSPSTPTSAPPRSGLPTTRRGPLLRQIMSYPSSVSRVFPTVAAVMARLPLPLLPFAFGMFILVQGLAHVGFINIMAAGLGRVCAHGVTATAFFMATLGVILCNVRENVRVSLLVMRI